MDYSAQNYAEAVLRRTALSVYEPGVYGVSVGFSTTDKLISRFIRFFTRATVSHAWVAFNDHTLRQRYVIQAESWGLEMRPWNTWVRQNRLVREYILLGEQPLHGIREYAAERIGSKYDFLGAARAGLVRRFRWLRHWSLFKASTPNMLMCAEFTSRFLIYALDYHSGSLLKEPELVTPDELMSYLDSRGDRFIRIF